MDIYLVGGAVRDALLGERVVERDFVVVGSTPDAMRKLGYKQVGKDFPVFLHPETGEEYALARTERKIDRGYDGFSCFSAPTVTLEEDLMRRDLTINAIAQDQEGQLIDPYGGQRDLKDKLLRHVSKAFVEDPLRVLRLARFAARFPDFTVAPETMACLKEMVASGELKDLTRERVWQEMQKALLAKKPQRFLDVLSECGALSLLCSWWGTEDWQLLSHLPCDLPLRFAMITYTLSQKAWQDCQACYPIPSACVALKEALSKTDRYGAMAHEAQSYLGLYQVLDAFRQTALFSAWHQAIVHARPDQKIHWDRMMVWHEPLKSMRLTQEEQVGLSGPAFGQALSQKRLKWLSSQMDQK